MSTQSLPGVTPSSGASPHDTATRLEEENYLQYTRQQYNTIQANFILTQLQQQVAGMQQAEQEDQPPQDPEERAIWRAKTIHGGLPPERVNRRLQADPDEETVRQVSSVVEQRRLFDLFYQRGQQHANYKLHAGAALPDKLARVVTMAGDDGRLMYDEAESFALRNRMFVGPPGVSSGLFGKFQDAAPTGSEWVQGGVRREAGLSPEQTRDFLFDAMKAGYAETLAKASGSRKLAVQALETIGSTIPFVAAAPAMPGGVLGTAATGAALGAAEPLSGEDKQAVDQARERGGDADKMERQLRALRSVESAVSWGMMGLGAKAGVGNTVAGRLKQAAGMQLGSEAGTAAAEAVTGPERKDITGKDPGASSAIGKALHALSDPGLSSEERKQALLEAGTHFAVGLGTFGAIHVATGLRELAPRTMARPENKQVVEELTREARADLRKQDVEPGVVAQVLPTAEKVPVRIDTSDPGTGTQEGKAELSAPLPPEPHITPPGPPKRLSKAEREAVGEVLAPGTKFKLHESVSIGGGGDLEVVRNEVGAKGVIQVKTEAGKTIDFTPDMLDLVLPESIQAAPVASSVAQHATQHATQQPTLPQAAPAAEPAQGTAEAPPTQPAPTGLVRGTITPTSEGTVPAFSRTGRRPEPTMEVPVHDAESPMAIRTKEGQRVPVEVTDPQGPIITAGATLPDGTRVEAWGETLSEAAGKLEEQVGQKGTIEATTDLGRAVEAAQKAKAKAELKEKMPRGKVPAKNEPQYATEPYGRLKLDPEQKQTTEEVVTKSGQKEVRAVFGGGDLPRGKDPQKVRDDVRDRFIKEAKRMGSRIEFAGDEIRVYRRLSPEAGVMLNPVHVMTKLVERGWKRLMRRGAGGVVREMDLARAQEEFAKTIRQGVTDFLAKNFGGPSRRIGMELADTAKQHWYDMNARLGRAAERLYDHVGGVFRKVRIGSDEAHDMFVAADRPGEADGKEALKRVQAAGLEPELRNLQRELEMFRRFWAGHTGEAPKMRERIRNLRDAVAKTEQKLADQTYLAKVPAPLAKHIRAKVQGKLDAWRTELGDVRTALAGRIKNWGKTGGYMHHVFQEMQNDVGFQGANQAFLQRVDGAQSIGFRALKKRMGAEGFIEDAIVSTSHYMSGAIRKIYIDRILKDMRDRMQGQWRRIGQQYTDKNGETQDPLNRVKVGEQFRQGPDLVQVRDVERNEAGDVTGVQVQIIGAGKESQAHPAEWLVPDEARSLERRFGLQQMAERAKRTFLGFTKTGNRAFLDAYKEYEDLIRRGGHTDILGMIDATEAVMRKAQGYLFNTISRWFPGSLRSAPANFIQNSATITEKIGPDNYLRGVKAATEAFADKTSEYWHLLKRSGVMDRRYSRADFAQETGRLMPREGVRRAVDVADKAMGALYDFTEQYSRATAFLGHYLALRPEGMKHQPDAIPHDAAMARARETVEQSCGIYDKWMAPAILRSPWLRLGTSMKGYMLRQVGEYLPNRIAAARQTKDYRAFIRMAAGASAISGSYYLLSRLILGWDKTEGQSLSNRLGMRAKDVPFVGNALSAMEDQFSTPDRRLNLDWLTIPYVQTNLFDKGPGPDLWSNLADLFGAKDGREAIYRAELIGKALFSTAPYAFRQWAQATANPNGTVSTYDAGSVWEALMPYQKSTGPVRDKSIRQADLTLRLTTGTPVRDLMMQAANADKKRTEEDTRGQHADTLDMILDYMDAQREGRANPQQMDAIRERIREQGSMPDRGQLQRLARLRSMGREGRLLFQGTKEARAQAIQDYALLKGHDQQMLRMAVGELFKESGGLSAETVEKIRALVK